MCDERTESDARKYLAGPGGLSRRQFGALSAGAGLSMLLPPTTNAQAVSEEEVEVPTPDGAADCYFVHPAAPSAGVIVWPDIFGLRPAFRTMGRRLAESGYAVLVVNPYYRTQRAPVVEQSGNIGAVMPLARTLGPETHVTDARAFVAFLDQQASVDTDRKIGTTGYCMGGPIVMRTAAAVPDRVGAGASFHGGNLVSAGPDSPHLLIPQMNASFLFAIAENDDQSDPEAKNVLREAYDDAGLDAEIEVYEGAQHGWCALDSSVYNEPQAERAWARLLVLFATALS
jgi:carboxymethylenebutenolidase